MRTLALLAAGAGLAGCSTYASDTHAQRSERQLQQELSGRSAGTPLKCLPTYRTRDMVALDDDTILYRDGRTVYLARMNGRCSGLGGPGYALVTRSFGGSQLCSGDIAHVVDTTSRMFVGSCSFGSFTPYTRH